MARLAVFNAARILLSCYRQSSLAQTINKVVGVLWTQAG